MPNNLENLGIDVPDVSNNELFDELFAIAYHTLKNTCSHESLNDCIRLLEYSNEREKVESQREIAKAINSIEVTLSDHM